MTTADSFPIRSGQEDPPAHAAAHSRATPTPSLRLDRRGCGW